jgi:4-diphosphocytidyl-2-C-methyl-D-erythritol kinase
MILFPNAKINLGLRVLRKREDGYHDLDTLMLPIPLYDILEFSPADEVQFVQSGAAIPEDGKKTSTELAYHILKDAFGIGPVRIHLRKQIPIGAGLGGGSSDAAFALKGLNEWFSLNLSIPQLEQFALELGSDCPFFIQNTPAHAQGRGEILRPIDWDVRPYYLVLYNPGIHVSTAMAYGAVTPKYRDDFCRFPKETHLWQAHYVNDFEEPVGRMFPEIQRGIEMLKANGAIYAGMSGSGSSYFGIFEEKNNRIPEEGLIYSGRLGLNV